MWCDICNTPSYSVQTTVRLTKGGKEILVQYCGRCMSRVETEFVKGTTIRVHESKRNSTKRPLS
jgi:hypothetical protein